MPQRRSNHLIIPLIIKKTPEIRSMIKKTPRIRPMIKKTPKMKIKFNAIYLENFDFFICWA